MDNEATIKFIKLMCGTCHEENDYPWNDTELIHQSDECDLCGSHGFVRMDFTCKSCHKNNTIDISSW